MSAEARTRITRSDGCGPALYVMDVQLALRLFIDGSMDMRSAKWILLGIFLILDGLLLVGIRLGELPMALIAGICAIIAGILFIINR